MTNKYQKKRKLVLFDPKEWNSVLVNAQKCYMKPGTYLRKVAINPNIKVFDTSKVTKLILAINSYGNNLNQVAKVVNSTNSVYQADIQKIIEDFKVLQNIIDEIIHEYDSKE